MDGAKKLPECSESHVERHIHERPLPCIRECFECREQRFCGLYGVEYVRTEPFIDLLFRSWRFGERHDFIHAEPVRFKIMTDAARPDANRILVGIKPDALISFQFRFELFHVHSILPRSTVFSRSTPVPS